MTTQEIIRLGVGDVALALLISHDVLQKPITYHLFPHKLETLLVAARPVHENLDGRCAEIRVQGGGGACACSLNILESTRNIIAENVMNVDENLSAERQPQRDFPSLKHGSHSHRQLIDDRRYSEFAESGEVKEFGQRFA